MGSCCCYILASIMAATSGGAAIQPDFSWNAEQAEPPVGMTFTRSGLNAMVLGTTDGVTNWYQLAKPNEIRLQGLRRVQNLIPGSNTDMSVSPWGSAASKSPVFVIGVGTDPFGGTDVCEATFDTAFDNRWQAVPTVPGGTYVMSFYARRTSGVFNIHFYHSGSATAGLTEVTGMTSEWQRFSVTFLGSSSGSVVSCGVQDRNNLPRGAGLDPVIEFHGFQVERIQDASDGPSERVDSLTAYNANATGVRYFATARDGSPLTGGGYLSEPAATNLGLISSELSDGSWTKDSVAVADLGVTDLGIGAYRITPSSTNEDHRLFPGPVANLTGHTNSVIARDAGGRYLIVRTGGESGKYYAVFDLQAGVVTEQHVTLENAVIEDLGSGWYRCSVIADKTPSRPIIYLSATPTPGTDRPEFPGAGAHVDIAHVQTEATPYATSPILTTGSAQTRNRDDLATTGPGFGNEYTLFFDVTWPSVITVATALISRVGSSNNRIDVQGSGSPFLRADFFSDAIDTRLSVPPAGSRSRYISRHKQNDTRSVATGQTGVAASVNTSTGIPTSDNFVIASGGFSNKFRGLVHRVSIYEVGLEDEVMDALVS